MKRVIVINSDDNFNEINEICSNIASSHETVLPLSPAHMFSFLDIAKQEEYESALGYCLNLINDCDELWVFGNWETSERCKKVVNMAQLLNKTVRYWGKLDNDN